MPMKVAVAFLLLAALAAAQQFPFLNGPLEESLNSNKVFFKVKGLADISGVWETENAIVQPLILDPSLYDPTRPFNLTCDLVREGGWSYDLFITIPGAIVIDGSPEAQKEGTVGRVVDLTAGGYRPLDVVDYESDGLMRHTDGCTKWRAYFDWEVGTTMIVQNKRWYFWGDENGNRASGLEDCNHAVETHPKCFEGQFVYGGAEREGVVVDSVAYYQCIAGPCLNLAHGLPGFVQTQGYVPSDPMETLIGSAEQVVVEDAGSRHRGF